MVAGKQLDARLSSEQEKIRAQAVEEGVDDARASLAIAFFVIFAVSFVIVASIPSDLVGHREIAIGGLFFGSFICYLYYKSHYNRSRQSLIARAEASYTCEKCGSPFAIKLNGQKERFLAAVPKSASYNTGQGNEDIGGPNRRFNVVETRTWTEEHWEVQKTFICVVCHDERSVIEKQTRRSNSQSSSIRRYD